jgi:hypothetical protein
MIMRLFKFFEVFLFLRERNLNIHLIFLLLGKKPTAMGFGYVNIND